MNDGLRVRDLIERYFYRRYDGFAGNEVLDFAELCLDGKMEEEEKRYFIQVEKAKSKGLLFSVWKLNLVFRRLVIMQKMAWVEVEEQHKVIYSIIGFPPSTMKGALHNLKLKKVRNRWYIVEHSCQDETGECSEGIELKGDTGQRCNEEIKYYSETGERVLSIYDRQAAVRYAHRWALDRNPKYYDFEDLGGDCTNFCSQVIHAGGAPMKIDKRNGWYYLSLNSRYPSWTGVEFLYRFLVTNKGRGPQGEEVSSAEIEIGDVIQLDFPHNDVFNHSPVVVSNPEPGNINRILVSTHTIDRDNYPLIFYNWRNIRFIHIKEYGV